MAKRRTDKLKRQEISLWTKPSKEIYSYGESIVLEYYFVNDTERDVFLIEDRQYTLLSKDPDALVCEAAEEKCTVNRYLAELPLPDNLDLAGYMPPRLRIVKKGESSRGFTAISMPLRETIINENNQVEAIKIRMNNNPSVILSIGYGFSEFSPDLRAFNTLEQFLAWQHLIDSNQVKIAIQ